MFQCSSSSRSNSGTSSESHWGESGASEEQERRVKDAPDAHECLSLVFSLITDSESSISTDHLRSLFARQNDS